MPGNPITTGYKVEQRHKLPAFQDKDLVLSVIKAKKLGVQGKSQQRLTSPEVSVLVQERFSSVGFQIVEVRS